jgi:glutamine amidotransferase
MKKVAIIDYELGNLFSVRQACLSLGADAFLTSDYKEVQKADMVILPGVGAFGQAMNNLKKFELDRAILDSINEKKPFMGVCLGLQLLFEGSEEFGSHEGLGIFPGMVKKFPNISPTGEKLLIPQIAWNKICFSQIKKWETSPLSVIGQNEYFYFVHSYFVDVGGSEFELSRTNYNGLEYSSSVFKNNIFAVQFHPEKSGVVGLNVYKKWLNQ